MEKIEPHREKALHTAINMDPVQSKLFTAVGAASPTGSTRTARNVGINGAFITNLYSFYVRWNLDNFSREFMP
jgi:hypothetical protein